MISKFFKFISGDFPDTVMDEYHAEEPLRPSKNPNLFVEKEVKKEIPTSPLVEIILSVSKPFSKNKKHTLGKPVKTKNDVLYTLNLYIRSAPYGKGSVALEKETFEDLIKEIQAKKLAGKLYCTQDSEQVLRYVITRGPIIIKEDDDYFIIYGFDSDSKTFICFSDYTYNLYYHALEQSFDRGAKAYALEQL